MDFYDGAIHALLKTGDLAHDSRVLVVCGGPYDAEILRACGLRDVTISNLDTRNIDYGAFNWSYQDAEALTFDDASFDWVVVHAGLHHCVSPHRALLEMYRVARKGVVVIEARDSILMRAGVALGFTSDFELEAVVLEGGRSGGVRNSAVPNFIYRWTEREFRKTIESAYPQAVHEFRFWYDLQLPTRRLAMRGPTMRVLASILGVAAYCAQRILPKQGNRFGAAILKTGHVKPWIDPSGTCIRADYQLGFDASRYGKSSAPTE